MSLPQIYVVNGPNCKNTQRLVPYLKALYEVKQYSDWNELPGKNDDPKILLRPTSPVIAYVDEHNCEEFEQSLALLNTGSLPLNRRHPILIIAEKNNIAKIQHLFSCFDDYLHTNFNKEELLLKLQQIIDRTNTFKKLSRDLDEASEIALHSMSHSSELGEISRFILSSYECNTYEDLFNALFKTIQAFYLEGSALIIVDDTVTMESVSGIVSAENKDKMLKYHATKRIIQLGEELIISYEHGSIMIHNMPIHDQKRYGRFTDNLAVLGYCFEARIRGIDSELKAEQASRAKTMFLATMSHELRTPLNSVIGYTGRLMRKLEGRLSDKEHRQLDAIRRNGDHLLKLINDILDVSKIEVGQMEVHFEKVDIVQLIRNVYDQLLPIAQNQQLQFTIELETEHFEMEADPKRFTQILMNLVSNAIKYTAEGTVNLTFKSINDAKLGKAVSIAVQDTGIGINQEDQDKLFCNFVQIDSALSRTVEGSGLGLAISAFLAKRHRGRIDLSSTPGKGSCFTLVLPEHPHQT